MFSKHCEYLTTDKICFLLDLSVWNAPQSSSLCHDCLPNSHDIYFYSYQFKRFQRELIAELEKKTDMDVKYMTVSIFLTETVISLLNCFPLHFVMLLSSTVVQRVALLPLSSRFELELGLLFVWSVSCSLGVCDFPVQGFSGFLVLPKNMSIGGLDTLNYL